MKHKLKAFSIHFLASLCVAAIAITIVMFVWYPEPLYTATGVIKIFLMLVGIDLILGPLLTFIVYKPHKKTLKFDLAVIVLLQLSAFSYGFYQLYDGRPVWVAYSVDRFDLVRNNEVDDRNLSEADNNYQAASVLGPKYVASVLPKSSDDSDIERRNQFLLEEVSFGIAPSQRPELYQPLASVAEDISNRAQDVSVLLEFNESDKVETILAKYPKANGFLPLRASSVDMTVLIDKNEPTQVIKIVDLRPW